MLISIETHRTCDFPGGEGGPDPLPTSGSVHANSVGIHMLLVKFSMTLKIGSAYTVKSF